MTSVEEKVIFLLNKYRSDASSSQLIEQVKNNTENIELLIYLSPDGLYDIITNKGVGSKERGELSFYFFRTSINNAKYWKENNEKSTGLVSESFWLAYKFNPTRYKIITEQKPKSNNKELLSKYYYSKAVSELKEWINNMSFLIMKEDNDNYRRRISKNLQKAYNLNPDFYNSLLEE